MLVLTRRMDESLIIGDNIIVKVLAIEGDKVKLGIEAPREISILRNELYEAVMQQNLIASHLAAGAVPDSFKQLREMLSEDNKSSEANIPSPQQP